MTWFLIIESDGRDTYAYRETASHYAEAERDRQERCKRRRSAESLDADCWLASGDYVVVEMHGELTEPAP
jgi:hypothetical protein